MARPVKMVGERANRVIRPGQIMVDSKEPDANMETVNITSRLVGDLVRERLDRAKIFERYGIDYFCGGKESLSVSCSSRGIDVDELVQELTDLDEFPGHLMHSDWSRQTLAHLVDHIDSTHNLFLKRELPRLLTVIDSLRKSYSKTHPELSVIRDIFRNLTMELGIHVLNDERLLFPLCRNPGLQRETSHNRATDVKTLVQIIEAGNQSAADAMKKIRDLTNQYAFPPDVGNSYKFMLQALRGLEADLHLHIHEENNVLFPLLLTEDFSPNMGTVKSPEKDSWH